MRCKDAEKLILLQDSGELESAQAAGLDAHLAGCEACRGFAQVLAEASMIIDLHEEPSAASVQNVLRAARLRAPARKRVAVMGWKPALAMAASVAVIFGLLVGNYGSDRIGMELMVNDAQLLELEDQVVSIMYDGLSEDDLAFNFLMTYEGNLEG